MANRPCNPDSDLKKLWHLLMPGVALPACGTVEDQAPQDEPAEPAQQQQTARPPRD